MGSCTAGMPWKISNLGTAQLQHPEHVLERP